MLKFWESNTTSAETVGSLLLLEFASNYVGDVEVSARVRLSLVMSPHTPLKLNQHEEELLLYEQCKTH